MVAFCFIITIYFNFGFIFVVVKSVNGQKVTGQKVTKLLGQKVTGQKVTIYIFYPGGQKVITYIFARNRTKRNETDRNKTKRNIVSFRFV
jgi:hypothetical protein